MKRRFILYRRKRGGVFYLEDTQAKKQESLHTTDRTEALSLLNARNESVRQPQLNLQIAKAYLAGADSDANTRTWQDAMDILVDTKHGSNQERWIRALPDKAFDLIRDQTIIETKAELLLKVLQAGTVSTNIFLRQIHNFCVDMNWLPWPILPKRRWPAIRYKDKRAITLDEHCRIVERERNPERKTFYQMAWHLGASQSDLAHLQAEDVDWQARVICFFRMKTRWRGLQPPQIRFGKEVEAILKTLPKTGALFPRLIMAREKHRAKEFKRRCVGLGIEGVTLHSYRYAWAERAKVAGYPERFAQEALGHNSKAVHRAYAKKAQVVLPPLEDYERKIVPAASSAIPCLATDSAIIVYN